MLLQPNQPQEHLLVPLLLRSAAQLLSLLVLHPPCQPDDRQGERLLLHTLRQLLQEHHHVWQLCPQHQVLVLNSVFWGQPSVASFQVLEQPLDNSRKCRDTILPAASVTEETRGMMGPDSLFGNCPQNYLRLPFCYSGQHSFFQNVSHSGTTCNILKVQSLTFYMFWNGSQHSRSLRQFQICCGTFGTAPTILELSWDSATTECSRISNRTLFELSRLLELPDHHHCRTFVGWHGRRTCSGMSSFFVFFQPLSPSCHLGCLDPFRRPSSPLELRIRLPCLILMCLIVIPSCSLLAVTAVVGAPTDSQKLKISYISSHQNSWRAGWFVWY